MDPEKKEEKKEEKEEETTEKEEPKPVPLDLSEAFGRIRETTKFADVIFTVGDQKFPAHRLVLASASILFEVMLYARQKDGGPGALDVTLAKAPLELKIEDTDPAIFSAMLQCIYTDEVEVNASNIQGLMKLATKYQVEKLKIACASFMEGDINKDNALDLFEIAPSLLGDKEFGLSFIEENAGELIETEGFLKLSKPRLEVLLQSDKLGVEEAKLFQALLKWGEAEAKRQKKEEKEGKELIKDLLKYIRFPTMDATAMASIVAPSGVLDQTTLVPLFSYVAVTDEKIRALLPSPGFPTNPREGTDFVFTWDTKKKAKFVFITAKHSRHVLALMGNDTKAGTTVVQKSKQLVGNDGQLWKLSLVSGKQHYIQSKLSKLFLEVKDSSSADYAQVVVGPKTGKDNQKWNIEKGSDGSLTITNVASSKSLDVNGSSYSDGTALVQMAIKYSSFDNQRFLVDPA